MDSRNAYIYEFDDEDIEDDAQSTRMPYYEDEEYEEAPIDVNDDAYWDIYFEPTVPDILNRSFSD